MSKDPRQHETDVAEAGCAEFEKTLGLLDGLLSGAERVEAEQHAGSCPVCAPLVRSWAPVGESLRDHFESAAERAKPDLAGLSEQVFALIDGKQGAAAKDARRGWFSRLLAALRPSQPYYAFAAAAAVAAIVMVPVVYSGGSAPTTVVGSAPHHCDLDNDVHQELGEVNDESGFHMHSLSFGSAKGSVLTTTDGTPMIWVSEHDGA